MSRHEHLSPYDRLGKKETIVIMGDEHVPFEDTPSVDLTINFISKIKPDTIIKIGDTCDFYSISPFDQDPIRKTTLKQDMDAGYVINRRVAEASPKSRRFYLKGNHCFRFEKYIRKNPVLVGMIDFNEKIGINDFDYVPFEYGQSLVMRGILRVTHGGRYSNYSGGTARMHLNEGVSCVVGHSHRLGTTYTRDFSGMREGAENGCLCQYNLGFEWFRQEYVNWQHGFTVVKFTEDNMFHIDNIPIPDENFIIYEGKEYKLK